MTVCDECGELCDSLKICRDCLDAREDLEEFYEDSDDTMSDLQEHNRGLCNPHQCRHCEDERELK